MWDNLSMAERAKIIKIGVESGLVNMNDIRQAYKIYKENDTDSNKFDDGGGLSSDTWKPWYWFTPRYEGENLKEAIEKAIDDGREGENIIYKGKAYKALLNKREKQAYINRHLTNEQIVDSYIDNVLYVMENPKNKGLKGKKWKKYTDKDAQGNTHINIGPGIESNSAIGSDINYNKTYTTKELNAKVKKDLMVKMDGIMEDLHDKYGEDADTMSMGNRMILLDIAHNVKPKGSKKKNMPKAWSGLTKGMMTGDTKAAKQNTYSGSKRRQDMRNDLLWKNTVDNSTVKNR